MKRLIKKVAVIGSGIMGSGIACHFANIGVEVLLLDIVPRELTEAEQKKGLTLESKVVRNRVVHEHLANALKSKPAPIYHQKFASRITTGNTTDDLAKIADVDWIIEVVIERLDIKKQVFEQIEKYSDIFDLLPVKNGLVRTFSNVPTDSGFLHRKKKVFVQLLLLQHKTVAFLLPDPACFQASSGWEKDLLPDQL